MSVVPVARPPVSPIARAVVYDVRPDRYRGEDEDRTEPSWAWAEEHWMSVVEEYIAWGDETRSPIPASLDVALYTCRRRQAALVIPSIDVLGQSGTVIADVIRALAGLPLISVRDGVISVGPNGGVVASRVPDEIERRRWLSRWNVESIQAAQRISPAPW
jgi:hypothetical protein